MWVFPSTFDKVGVGCPKVISIFIFLLYAREEENPRLVFSVAGKAQIIF